VSVNVVPYKEGKRAVEISDTKRKLGKGVPTRIEGHRFELLALTSWVALF
jgi:hypothetical protein